MSPGAGDGQAGQSEATAEQRLLRWARPLRVHLSVIIVLLLVAISVPLMWLTFQEGRQAAIASAQQQMRLLSRNTIGLYASVFHDGNSVVTMGSVLPSLAAEPPEYFDAKREYLVRALKGTPHIDAVYVGYPSGAFFQVMRATNSPKWHAAVSAPDDAVFAMRVVTREPDRPALARWYFLDDDGLILGTGPEREVDFDPRRRPWYRDAVSTAGTVTTGPYVSASTEALTLTLASTMVRQPGTVIGADVMLETISRMLIDQAVSENSVGYVFDGEGKLIVHSDPVVMAGLVDSLSTRSVSSRTVAANDPILVEEIAQDIASRGADDLGVKNDAVLAAVERLLAKGGEAHTEELVEFHVGKEPWLARIASAGEREGDDLGGYKIVIAAPIADFTAANLALLRQKLLIAGVLVVIGVLTALLISRRISRALVSLAADANQIGNLDFQSWKKTRSLISEINMLGKALSSARDAIKTFAVYVPRELVRQIVASGQAAAGAAIRREVTVLFTDIKDFTTISEQAAPEAVVEMLSVYFETVNAIVQRHNGVIVQYLGDSIYAMWNAPTENPHHVADGCRCALEMKAAITALNAENVRIGRPELVTRFGLHTGVAVVGSVGAEERRQYTAMGDTVNVASRLEGMNKDFATTILVSAAVADHIGLENSVGIAFRPLGAAHAKGRHKEIQVFELLDPHGGKA